MIGAGTLGPRIALMFASRGGTVRLYARRDEQRTAATQYITENLPKLAADRGFGEVGVAVGAASLEEALHDAWLVVESVPEKLEIKRAVLTEADKLLRPEVILTSNTSSIAITTLAAMTKRPERFVGMHFMNPVPVMVLVEVIRALQTSEATFETTMKLTEKLEKKPVAVAAD